MLIACPYCRGQMEVADEVQTQGGSFACPHCQKNISMSPGGGQPPPGGGAAPSGRKFSLPKISVPRIPISGRFLRIAGAAVVGIAAIGVILLIIQATCAPSTPKGLQEELEEVFADLHTIERARACERLLKDKDTFEAGKPYEVEKVDEQGQLCREISKSKPSKRRMRCEKRAERVVGLMQGETKADLSGAKKKMVSRCLEEYNPGVIDCVLTAKTIEEAKACEDMVDPTRDEDEPEAEYAGLVLAEAGDCAALQTSLPEKVHRYENTLVLESQLYCGADGTPELLKNDAVELAATASVQETLPKVVRAVGENKISANIGVCYVHLKKQVLENVAKRRKLRCKTLAAELEQVKPDMMVELTVFDRVLARYELAEEFEKHTADDVVGWSAAVENSTIPAYVHSFLLVQKESLCNEDEEVTQKQRYEAAIAAARNCM